MERLTGKRIMVTGGTGFVGSHLVEALIKSGNTVIVPYRSINPHSYFSSRSLEKKCVMAYGDVTDGERVQSLLTSHEIEYIFHLAAQAIVTTAYENPLETIKTNVMGTATILEAARLYHQVKCIIVASSDKAYGKSDMPYKETHPLAGDHPYEASKSSADLIALSYAKTYAMPVAVTRFGNIYGEGDLHFNRIIPGIMKAIVLKEKFMVRSDGTYRRDYLYVKDVVSGYILLASHIEKTQGQAWNFGSSDNKSVFELISLIQKSIGKKLPYSIQNEAKNEILSQHVDYEKIRHLGWKPKHSLRLQIKPILSWYKKTLRRYV